MRSKLTILTCCLVLVSCRQQIPVDSATIPQQYVLAAIDTMQAHSRMRGELNWERLRREALDESASYDSIVQTYPVVARTLEKLGDKHSFFLDPEAVASWTSESAHHNVSKAQLSYLGQNVAKIDMPTSVVVDSASVSEYVARLRGQVSEISDSQVCGVIIDLASNRGGNMWAMLAGLSPLLPSGQVGLSVFPDSTVPWLVTDSTVAHGTTIHAEFEAMDSFQVPAAVITGSATASSGEALAIAFMSNTNSRRFGASTAGATSGNKLFELSDGAGLALSTAAFADLTGRTFPEGVPPDELASEGISTSTELALDWLATDHDCN